MLIHFALEHRGTREREGDCESDVPGVEDRRMDRQPRILQQRVQVPAVRRRRVEPQEGIGGCENEQQEAQADDSQHAKDAR